MPVTLLQVKFQENVPYMCKAFSVSSVSEYTVFADK